MPDPIERRERIGRAVSARRMNQTVRLNRPRVVYRPWSCGFCADVNGRCRDYNSRCRGTFVRAVPRTDANPEGSITCACFAAAHHHKELAIRYKMPWEV